LHSVTSSPRVLTYLVTYTEPGTTHANWRGDTLDTLVRLNFMGAPWRQTQSGYKDAVDQFILHEMFHTAASPALNPNLPGAMTLSEGGAEAGAMAIRRSNGTAADNDADIDKGLALCHDLTGATLAVFHLLKQYCSQSYGFFSEPGVFILDAPPGKCGVVPDKFRMVAMNGLRMDVDAYRAFATFSRHCATGLPVELTDDHGKKIALACTKPPTEVVIYTLAR
jgi:hypothetical protein